MFASGVGDSSFTYNEVPRVHRARVFVVYVEVCRYLCIHAYVTEKSQSLTAAGCSEVALCLNEE